LPVAEPCERDCHLVEAVDDPFVVAVLACDRQRLLGRTERLAKRAANVLVLPERIKRPPAHFRPTVDATARKRFVVNALAQREQATREPVGSQVDRELQSGWLCAADLPPVASATRLICGVNR